MSLLRSISLALLLCGLASAQLATMEAIPTPRSIRDSCTGSTCAYLANVVSGEALIVIHTTRAVTTGPTISDSLTSTWNSICTQTTGTAKIYAWMASAASSGADTVTITATGESFPNTTIMDWANLSTTLDGTCTTAQNSLASHVANLPSITTTKYRDLLLGIVVSANSDGVGPNNTAWAPLSNSSSENVYVQTLLPSTNPGATGTSSVRDVNANTTVSQAVIAIESTTSLAVSTTTIPDAIRNQTYNFQLGATGGDGTNTWSITSGLLPAGLSLSSGGNINGSCTNSNPNSITFKVTDTNSHTASKSLTLTCANSANTIALLQTKAVGGGTQTFNSNVTSGSMILLEMMNQTSGSIPYCTGSLGETFVPLPGISYSTIEFGREWYYYLWGFTTSGGTHDSITCTGSITPQFQNMYEYSNVQQIFDTDVVSKTLTEACGSTLTSGAATLPVSETAIVLGGVGTVGSSTITSNAPFADQILSTGGFGRSRSANEIGAAQGSTTASFAVANNTNNECSAMLFGFRPTSSGLAPAGGVRHKSQVY